MFGPGPRIEKLLPELLSNDTVSLKPEHDQPDPFIILVAFNNTEMFKIFYVGQRGLDLKDHEHLIAAIRLAIEKDCREMLDLILKAGNLDCNFEFKWTTEDDGVDSLLAHATVFGGLQVTRFLLSRNSNLSYDILRDTIMNGSKEMRDLVCS